MSVPGGAWGDLGMAGATMNQLSEAEQLARKKKILSAGQSNDFQTATQFLFGNRAIQSGSVGG
jgi:hypothetical protein